MTELQSARIERILAATKRLLGTIGLERMTMKDVAVASDVAEATLYNRFGTKDNLVSAAVVDYFETRIRRNVEHHACRTPIEKVLVTAQVVAEAVVEAPEFTRGLMNTWFDCRSERSTTLRLADTISASWIPILLEMRAQRLLAKWVSLKLLSDELRDREFGVVVRWAQGQIADRRCRDHLAYASLMPLLGVSRGKQVEAITTVLEALTGKLDGGASPPK
jgi:AcrR family transcriptional regulator